MTGIRLTHSGNINQIVGVRAVLEHTASHYSVVFPRAERERESKAGLYEKIHLLAGISNTEHVKHYFQFSLYSYIYFYTFASFTLTPII